MAASDSSDRSALVSHVRAFRERASMSQKALAEAAGVSRQAIVAIEGSGQVPSTTLALRLADVLGCRVEQLFTLLGAEPFVVEQAPGGETTTGGRVVVGRIGDRWVAHALPSGRPESADALAVDDDGSGLRVTPLDSLRRLEQNVLVAGCAPLLGVLAGRARARFDDARCTWLPGTSGRSLDLLEAGAIHVAGVHLPGAGDVERVVRRRFPKRTMLIINLTRWREGIIVPEGNPRGIRSAEDLLAPGLRFAGREEGAGAHRLVRDLLVGAGAPASIELPGPLAEGHSDVAKYVRCGAADAGVAIESVALAAGLDFVPLMEERFDLVLDAATADHPPVARLLSLLDHTTFRSEVDRLPGYDSALSGHVTTVEAA